MSVVSADSETCDFKTLSSEDPHTRSSQPAEDSSPCSHTPGAPRLERFEYHSCALLGDPQFPGGVCFGFTERGGGVSRAPYASLNLGSMVGDDPRAVAENRRRALLSLTAFSSATPPTATMPVASLPTATQLVENLPVTSYQAAQKDFETKDFETKDFEAYANRLSTSLIVPKQVHGTKIVSVTSSEPAARDFAQKEAEKGADAVIVTVPNLAVCLCFADCVPLVFVAPDGSFAVAHSGWRGTKARIASKVLKKLCELSGSKAKDVLVYVGPHIAGQDYEVSPDLLKSFVDDFGTLVRAGHNRLSLVQAIKAPLIEEGILETNLVSAGVSTVRESARFYSWRAEGGVCGRHGAVAFRRS